MIDQRKFGLIFCCWSLLSCWSIAQPVTDYQQVDDYALRVDITSEQDLSALFDSLTAQSANDAEKVRRFFVWITHRIRYDKAAALALEKEQAKKSLDAILKSRKAICSGYAELMSALCKKAHIPCEIVSGYSKNFPTSRPTLKEPDHAWNAVQINGTWYLLDATWAAGMTQAPEAYPKRDFNYYYRPDPARFLLDHLPADPLWQLVNCPLPIDQFSQSTEGQNTVTLPKEPCFSFKDSLQTDQLLNPEKRQLKSLRRAYLFHPSPSNSEQLGHAYMDQFIRLSEREEQLRESNSIDSLLALYQQLFPLADLAGKYITLYDWQKENLAYIHINYAVALSRKVVESDNTNTIRNTLFDMQKNLLLAQNILLEIPQNTLSQNGLTQCKEYLVFTEEQLQSYR